MQDKPDKRTRAQVDAVHDAALAIPAQDRASAVFAVLMQVLADNRVAGLSDVMQFVGHATHMAAQAGPVAQESVGMLLRALVISIAGGVGMAVPEDREDEITPQTLMQEIADVLGSPEAVAAHRDCQETFRDMIAQRDILSDLDKLAADDSLFDGLLEQ